MSASAQVASLRLILFFPSKNIRNQQENNKRNLEQFLPPHLPVAEIKFKVAVLSQNRTDGFKESHDYQWILHTVPKKEYLWDILGGICLQEGVSANKAYTSWVL